jgi:integrase
MTWCGAVRCGRAGKVGRGWARQGRQGTARRGWAGPSKAGEVEDEARIGSDRGEVEGRGIRGLAGGEPRADPWHNVIAATLKYWATYTENDELAVQLREERTKRLIRRPLAEPKEVKAALSPAELEAFLEALGDRHVPPWAIPCLGLMAKLGLRSNDMLRLTRGDVKKAVDSDRLRIVGKGEKVRWLPTSPVEEELQLLLDIDEPEDWVHVWDIIATGSRDEDNRPEYAYHQVWQMVNAVAKLAGIERMNTHRLRKAAARRLYEASGHNLAQVTKFLGHSDSKTTLTYLEVDLDEYLAETGELMKR